MDDRVFWVRKNLGNLSRNFWELMDGEDSTKEDNLQLEFVELWELSSNDEMDVSHVTRSGKYYLDPPMPQKDGSPMPDKGK